jgi:hypothetical protein
MVVIRAAVALGRELGAGRGGGGLGRGPPPPPPRGGGGPPSPASTPAAAVGSGPVGKMNLDFLFSFRHILDFFNKLHVGPRPPQQNDLCFCHLSADKSVPHVRTAVNWL